MYHSVPYKCIPKFKTKYLFEGVISWLTYFLSSNNTLQTASLAMIVQDEKKQIIVKGKLLLMHMFWCILALETTKNQGSYQKFL